MVGPQPHTHQVWDHKANKANHAADGHRRSDQQGAAQQQDPLYPGNIHPEIVRLFITQLQQIEWASQPPDNQNRRHHQRGHRKQGGPLRLPEAAHSPERKLAKLRIVAKPGKETDGRAAQGVDGDPHQQ